MKPISLFCLLVGIISTVAAQDLVIKSADRTIDLTSQLVKITQRLTLSNTGKSAVSSFEVAIDAKSQEHLSYFKAQPADSKDATPFKAVSTKDKNGALTYKVSLANSLGAGQTVKVLIGMVFTHNLALHPAEITQKEKQLVRYRGSAYIYSPYKINTQTTKVLLPGSNVETFTKVKPSSQSDATITYGPYENIAPLTEEEVVVHYENNSPFLSVSPLVRHIEVSHWGNIAVEETLDIYHTGAKLKGSFSRFEYQRESSGVSSVKSFKTILPEFAADVYYRDEIGNISTSNLREDDGEVVLELRPRFPLFGGWKTHYVIGYNLPSYSNLYNSGDEFVLQMNLIDHIFDNMVVDDALVRIVLPEGATNIHLEAPYAVTRLPDSLHFTYLDVKGRPVIELRAKNLVENHIQEFKLKYNFSRIVMLQEPLLCAGAFFILFATFIIYARLDFSITKDEANESRLRAAALADDARIRFEKRVSLFHQFEEQLAKLKLTKDISAFQAATKNILAEVKAIILSDVITPCVKSELPTLADRLNELEKLEKLYREVQITHGTTAERWAAGKLSRPQFVDAEIQITKKKNDLSGKMTQIINTI